MLLLLASAVEGVGIISIISLFQNIENFTDKILLSYELPFYPNTEISFFLSGFNLLTIAVIFILFKGALLYLAHGYSAILRGTLLKQIRLAIFVKTRDVNYNHFTKIEQGTFINSFNEQALKAAVALHSMVGFFSLFFTTIVYIIAIGFLNTSFVYYALPFLLVVPPLFNKLSAKVVDRSSKIAIVSEYQNQTFLDVLASFKDLKSQDGFKVFTQRMVHRINAVANEYVSLGWMGAFTTSIREPVGFVAAIITICFMVFYNGLDLTDTFIVAALLYRIATMTVTAQRNLQGALEAYGALTNVESLLTDLERNKDDVALVQNEIARPLEHFNFVLKNYSVGEKVILKNIKLRINKGEIIGFFGQSGAGKSTLIDIICGLRDNVEGFIEVNSNKVSEENIISWRGCIGIARSDSRIYQGTVLENITKFKYRFINELEDTEQKKLMRVCKIACLDQALQDAKLCFDAVISHNTPTLSNGQKQRLILARELYSEPDLLIIDEGTNGLDELTERSILAAIKENQNTTIFVSHNLKAFIACDEVYALASGTTELIQKHRIGEQ